VWLSQNLIDRDTPIANERKRPTKHYGSGLDRRTACGECRSLGLRRAAAAEAFAGNRRDYSGSRDSRPQEPGKPYLFVTSLQIERERPELIAQLRTWLMAQELVQQIFYVTGQAAFVLVVTAPNAESYEALMARLMSDNPNVTCFTTSMVLTVIKRSLAIPVP
jgi:DNA-binding Lrp family transcriptional regulator